MKSDEQAFPFAIVPVEVMMDNRLTLETMRVLVTLFSFRNKITGLAFPTRDAISERCGMHPSNISDATTKLVELGWLIKAGVGGYSKSTRYTIQIPEIVAEQATVYKARTEARKVAQSATVVESATVAQQATPTVVESATRQVAQSATRKEQTNITDQLTDHIPDKSGNKKKAVTDTELQAACRATWKSYSEAYEKRYGCAPLRNAELNAAIKSFCKKLPYHEAPQVAAFYVSLNDKFYVSQYHPAPLMSKNAAKLRTQWLASKNGTVKAFDHAAQAKKEATERARQRVFGNQNVEVLVNEKR